MNNVIMKPGRSGTVEWLTISLYDEVILGQETNL